MNTRFLFPQNGAHAMLAAISISAISFSSMAAPAVTSVIMSEPENGSTMITIQGSGFGEKTQAAPVLFDQLDSSHENGVINKEFMSLTHGDKIPSTSSNEKSIWAGVSSGAWGSFVPEVTMQRPPRHETSQKHYLLKGHSSSVGNPAAYGGLSGWNTPSDNKQLYASWWYKPKYTPSLYWRISTSEKTGNFTAGETLDIGGIAEAEYIGIDTDGLLNMAFKRTPPNVDELLGRQLVGQKSGATTLFPTQFIDSSGEGYERPGAQKFIRIWEDSQGQDGIRFSWTQMHASVVSTDTSISSSTKWDYKDLKPNEWSHLELELDSNKGVINLFINSQPLTTLNFDPALDMTGYSPTVALLGLNGKVGKLQVSELDDIYIDKTLQRVAIGNAERLENVTHWEIQNPKTWDDTRIDLQAFQGSLENFENNYVYVFDKEGVANKTGFPLCSECQLPPSSIDLIIK